MSLVNIIEENNTLVDHYREIMEEIPCLNRRLVSFQANKKEPSFRWYKYKEAFSAALVHYFIKNFDLAEKRILDPFAGVGTTLFASSEFGCQSVGIELLPIGQKIIEAKKTIFDLPEEKDVLIKELKKIAIEKEWQQCKKENDINELRITKGAYPGETKEKISAFLTFIKNADIRIQPVLLLALLSILEEVSYTRKLSLIHI